MSGVKETQEGKSNFDPQARDMGSIADKLKITSKRALLTLIFSVASTFYFEVILLMFTHTSEYRELPIIIFSVFFGAAIFAVCGLLKESAKWVMLFVQILLFVLYAAECVIYNTFGNYFEPNFAAANGGEAAEGFGDMFITSIVNCIPAIILFLLPVAVWAVMIAAKHAKFNLMKSKFYQFAALAIICIGLFIGGKSVVYALGADDIITDREYYTSEYDFNTSVQKTGLLTAMRLYAEYSVFGTPDAVPTQEEFPPDSEYPYPSDEPTQKPTVKISVPVTVAPTIEPTVAPTVEPVFAPADQVLGYDFAALAQKETNAAIKSMHSYFATVEPTQTNKYTGIFEGKNLIFITAESFYPYFISEELTPALYEITQHGFVFSEYYQPNWGGTTTTGEFTNLFGLIPASISAMQNYAPKYTPFLIGQQLLDLGYTSIAFHNYTSTYYSRDKTHKNLGYANWIAIGNGLEMSSGWPRSDLEMMEKTIDYYIDKQPFSVYYMTVSGHANYSWSGNNMSARHKAEVADLPYSETVKAFIACNLEVEYAMRYILQRLDEAGILDNTVIVMSPDHYPYGLVENQDKDYFNELAGHELEKNFEYYKSCLVMYCSSIEEPIIISEPTYSLDILPTLLNLFGIDFDSRLFTGRDVLSDAAPLVIFPNGSFITNLGRYNASKGTWYPLDGAEVPDGYVSAMSKIVRNKIAIAKNIQEYDYFAHLKSVG